MMYRWALVVCAAFCFQGLLSAADDDVTFRSDVSLVRVDTQILDREHRAVTGLRPEDFVLLLDGKPQQIRNFSSEDLPVDVLLLLDVSGSMRPNVQRIAEAAHSALNVLGKDDRVAIMVFDRSTRVRMKFQKGRGAVIHELDSLLDEETFDGGTDITRGLLDAASYIGREGRKEARRAIVILTDDQTERDRDDERVGRALARADAVLSALIAPDMTSMIRSGRGPQNYPRGGGGYPGGGYPGGHPRTPGGGYPGGSTWPGGGSTWPGGGSTWPGGGSTWPGGGGGTRPPGGTWPHTRSAGTSEIARASGGDSMGVEDASAFETTLERIRQRYALHFNRPETMAPGEQGQIEVQLATTVASRYPSAEIRYRRVYMRPDGVDHADPVVVSHAPSRTAAQPSAPKSAPVQPTSTGSTPKRRVAVNDREGPRVDSATIGAAPSSTSQNDPPAEPAGGWRRTNEDPQPAPAANPDSKPAANDPQPESPKGGWRRVDPNQP